MPKRKRLFGNNKEFSDVILRMGAFHTRMTFLAVIGKRLGDTGLSDIFIEAGIVAAGSVSGVVEGRQYNRATRSSWRRCNDFV